MGIEVYTDKVISEHKDKPNFIAWMSAVLEKLQGIVDTNNTVTLNLDLDTAIGVQLDILGAIIGVNRLLTFQPIDGSSPILDDETYRFLLKSKAEQNKWQGTIEELYTIWNNVSANLPGITISIVDNQDMSFTIKFLEPIPAANLAVELILTGYIIPKPEGVRINYEITTSTEIIGLERHKYRRNLTRHTLLGVWHLGVDPFATVDEEVEIIDINTIFE